MNRVKQSSLITATSCLCRYGEKAKPPCHSRCYKACHRSVPGHHCYPCCSAPPLMPSNRLPSPFSPPFQLVPSCSSMTQKEVCQSTTWTSTMCLYVSVNVCVRVCVRERRWMRVIMPCHFEWCHVFFSLSFLFFLLDSSSCSAAPLCQFPVWSISLFYLLCVYSFISVSCSLPLMFNQGSRAFRNSSGIFSWLLYSICLCWQLLCVFFFDFFLDSVFARFQNWTSPWHWTLTHFSSGRHWVSTFTTRPFTMKDKGIKAATAPDQTAASEMWKNKYLSSTF